MSDPVSILPPNSTPVERALEAAIAGSSPDLTPVAALMRPETCPAHLLGWLAWAFSVDVWNPGWSEARKRAEISAALDIHRHKGTVGAVRRALEALKFRAEISEWFEHGGEPHTFRLDVFGDEVFENGFGIDQTLVNMILRVVERAKPLRSRFELRVGERYDTGLGIRAGCRVRLVDRAAFAPAPRTRRFTAPMGLRVGLRLRALSRVTHDIIRQEGAA